jgi:hypothetical protein
MPHHPIGMKAQRVFVSSDVGCKQASIAPRLMKGVIAMVFVKADIRLLVFALARPALMPCP